jgi:hypothetical protein
MIDSGTMTRGQVIESFFWSEEFGVRIPPIVRLYFAYFLRIPDYLGLMFWVNAYDCCLSLEAISDSFAGSEEFLQRYGSLSNEAFVDLLYQNVLGRDPDIEGYLYWVEELNSGRRTRGQVMLGFLESEEYRVKSSNEVFVTMMYVGMLRRSPDEAGFDFWVNYLDSGNSVLALINGFLYSEEYANRFQNYNPSPDQLLIYSNGNPIPSWGGPDLYYNFLADDFSLPCAATITHIRLWTLDRTPYSFAGTFSWYIYNDNHGTPGTLLSTGTTAAVTRFAAAVFYGDMEEYQEYQNDLYIGTVQLLPGRYWLALYNGLLNRPGGDGTSLIWVSSDITGSLPTYAQTPPGGPWFTEGAISPSRAFQLFGQY